MIQRDTDMMSDLLWCQSSSLPAWPCGHSLEFVPR